MSTMDPLTVSADNPRYLTPLSGAQRAVYLTGSHIWNNFHDGMGPAGTAPKDLDYGAYLDFLAARGHNFIRLWRWEHFRSQAAGGAFELNMTPQPWRRDDSGRFDLSRFDPAYFRRLRERVEAAGDRGMYVAVMLFDGWALHLSPALDNVEGHPFHAANNINGVGITSILDHQVLPLDPAVQALQEDYLRQVVDTVHDLPNVLYEVANESSGGGAADAEMAAVLGVPSGTDWGDSTGWQYWVIEFVKDYERQQGYQPRPVGMTMQFPVPDQAKVNAPLFDGPADWISPGFDDDLFRDGAPVSRWWLDPPAADGRKVLITDSDHVAPGHAEPVWVWKAFLRGHNPILMDYGLIDGTDPAGDPSPGAPPFAAFEPARHAMGDTRRYAETIDLISMMPRGDLTSTGYALADPGAEYLILHPGGGTFTATVASGTYAVGWHDITSRSTSTGERLTVANDEPTTFTTTGPAVLHLKRLT
ncbi:hypothetical protein [Actinocrispum sp. NPDC049592]|uniref:hypothetical protein n=1 Tax=Actinocrispum sp. NPDC049592 TaxID=3154835 RepID=UPI0034270478